MRLLAFLVLLAWPAGAEVLRSGEHGTFTRLAFAARDDLTWTIGSSGREMTIRFDPMPAFDLTQVFDRIDRSRVSSVRLEDGRLLLGLACTCAVEVARVDGRHVVLDVAERRGRPDASARAQAARVEPMLPLRLSPLPIPLRSRLGRAVREGQAAGRPAPRAAVVPSEDGPSEPRARAPQIAFRDGRAADSQAAHPTPAPPVDRCREYAWVDAMLSTDPVEARAHLPDLLATYERDAPDTARALAERYLAAGLASEAKATMPSPGPSHRLAMAAHREALLIDAPRPPLGCGAAVDLLAWAAGSADPRIQPDAAALLERAATLPKERAELLLPPAVDSLRGAGHAAIATSLDRHVRSSAADASLDPHKMAEVVIGKMPIGDATSWSDGTVADARALRRELPAGDLYTELTERLLVHAVIRGDMAEAAPLATALTETDRAGAIAAAVSALADLPPEEAAVRATSLLRLRAETPLASRVVLAEGLSEVGLDALAARWAGPGRDAPVKLAEAPPSDDVAWLSRDLEASAQADGPRAGMAALLIQPLPSDPPDTLVAARARLERARTARARLARLPAIADPETDP